MLYIAKMIFALFFFKITARFKKKKRKFARSFGKMPEWSIGTVSKTVVRVTVPRVRIPLFPQKQMSCFNKAAHLFSRQCFA